MGYQHTSHRNSATHGGAAPRRANGWLQNRTVCLTLFLLGACCLGDPRGRSELLKVAVDRGEGTWRKVESLAHSLTSREIFTYALALCEAGQHGERLGPLLTVAARMQDRDENSRGYGNFRWSWEDGAVLDYNAVDFCMQSGAILWLRHAQSLPAAVQNELRELLDISVSGCLRHRVPSSYTNIALMNALDLILLGQALGRQDAATEGRSRLDQICLFTAENGIHEYDSPTYYAVDLDCLTLLHALVDDDVVREQAEALLELFWTDIAANWFVPSQRIAGARSRDYDYLRGHGYVEHHVWLAGWPVGAPRHGTGAVHLSLGRWLPDERIRGLTERFPRLVEQVWGTGRMQTRTHWVAPDVTLSMAGANYGSMDLPFTVDLPGDEQALRCYMIPDARRDPYGKKRIPAGPHMKTLHVRPFWAGTQRERDALGVVFYRKSDYPQTPASLETHVVFPIDVDQAWIGSNEIVLDAKNAAVHPLPAGGAFVFRRGTALVGIRVPFARGLDGQSAPSAVVVDENPYGACRLTVGHHSFWGNVSNDGIPGAALWIRVASGIESVAAVDGWRTAFAAASVSVVSNEDGVRVSADGESGELCLAVGSSFSRCLEAIPAPSRKVLAIDGKDVGIEILGRLPVVRERKQAAARIPVFRVPATGRFEVEAEAGDVVVPMTVGEDSEAFGARYVWVPGVPGERGGGGVARVTWKLEIAEEGVYYLWGRVMAPTQDDDSFFVHIATDLGDLVDMADWHIGTHEDWEWTALSLNREPAPTPIPLPKGLVTVQLRVREDGAKIDRLMLTRTPSDAPF